MKISLSDQIILNRFAKNLVAQTLILEGAGWNIDDIHEECTKIVNAWAHTDEFLKIHTNVPPGDRTMQAGFHEYLFDKVEYIFNTLRTLVLTQDF